VLIYWWKWVNTRQLRFTHIPIWLLYPAVYAGLVLLREHFAGWYPYPFLDALKFGYPRILLNSGLLLVAFLLFSGALVFTGRIKK
jgi:hypothetical protein